MGMGILQFPIPRVGKIRWHSFIPLSAFQADISGKDGICDNRGTDYHHAWCSVPLYRLRRVVQSCGLPAAQKPSTADFRTEDRNHLLW